MKRESFTKLLLLILLFPLINGIGCGTAKSVYRLSTETAKSVSDKIRPAKKAVLRKKVLVSPIMNQARIREEKAAQFTDAWVNLLKKDGHILVTVSKGIIPSRAKIRSPQFGIVTDPEFIKNAEDMGMNVLIICILNPFEVTVIKSGIWPFRKLKREVEISMSVDAMDITNGTLFISNIEIEKIKIQIEDSEEQENRWEIDYKMLDDEISPILKRQASTILDTLNRQPWTSKIYLSDNKTIRINGGKDIGITEGNVFDVFGKGETIKSLSGKEFSFLGTKVGEIKSAKVMEDFSLAVPLNDEQFEDGQVIRLKTK
ncbi:hypothetical protein ACFL7M_06550 [Thermodesulfobacteriota bacterium]